MPIFDYQGVDKSGKNVKGSVEGESEKAVKNKLRTSGIYVMKLVNRGTDDNSRLIRVSSGNKGAGTNVKVKSKDLTNVTRQLSTLIKAKVPIVEALNAIYEQLEDEKFKEIIAHIKDKVNEGSALANAMKDYPRVFSKLYTSMIKAGEASGSLEGVLIRLADFIEKSMKLRNKILVSMTYPMVLGTFSLVVVAALLTIVVPKMSEMFEGQGKALPMITVMLISISNAVKNYWYVFLALMLTGGYFFKRYIETTNGRYWLDKKMLTLPVIKGVVKKVAVSRFTRTLSTLLSSGVPMILALEIVKDVVVNVVIGDAIADLKLKVQEGASIAKNLKSSGYFPPIVTHMIAIGEKSGGKELEEMLEKISESYDSEVESALTGMTAIIEPLLIMCLGGFVFFVVAAILIPIMEMSKI